ncbi:protein Peter pan [Coregonus clupeaformis]|uniref:protein Peter pan n=1 Tax=Coregonus clupeaformis TaxID=59861 RepID=UPI001BE0A528|nr:protein Peter pan [Coregonus clupeaformis]
MGKSKTKNQKKSRLSANHVAEEVFGAVPHSFVFHRGQVGKNVGQLVEDMRRVMEPFTAESLKVRKKNVLKDFVAVAGPLGVTHFMIFTKTPSSINMRLARLPKGPMLHFRVTKYSLIKDVVSSLKRHRMHEQQFTHHPLLVLNNFGSEGMHVKLMATMFQNMFPSINVHKVALNAIKRCVLLNYDPVSQEIEFRHYSLKVVPVGMSRGVKKLMQEKFPNMSKFEDISELLMKGANLSESEAEQDGDHNITELPQIYSGRGNMESQQSAVRLTEIGPRITMQLVKIEEGMGEGNILYHAVIAKTEEELQEILIRKEAQMKEKQERKKKQEQDVAQKKALREENKKRSMAGIKRKRQEEEEHDPEVEDPGNQDNRPPVVESDDEAEYYRQAVGEEPDEDMFPAAKRRQRPERPSGGPFKKRKPFSGDDSKIKYGSKSPHRSGPRGKPRDRMGGDGDRKEGKKFGGGGKSFGKMSPGGKRFGGKTFGDGDKRFGAKKFGDGDKRFGGKKFERGKKFGGDGGSKFKGKPRHSGLKKGPGGAKGGFKQRKGKILGASSRSLFPSYFLISHRNQHGTNMIEHNSSCHKFQVQLLPSMYGVEFCVALVGNLFALRLLATRERNNWHTGVVLSCNLAISDLLYVLTLPLLIVYYMQEKNWMFGIEVCKIERFLFTCNLYVSIYFIMCISVNRYVAIVYPFFTRNHVNPAKAKAASVVIWIFVTAISSPVLKFASTCQQGNNTTHCVSYSNCATSYEVTVAYSHLFYKLFLSVVGCFIPFLVTFASYCAVLRVVWRNANITSLEKRKVALMVFAVVVLYAISFVPYHLLQSYHLYRKVKLGSVCDWDYKAYQVSKGLATLNMCIHPLLYMAVFDSIRVTCCGRNSADMAMNKT